MDERQILLDAKELITRKQYQEARQLLKSISHNATAQKWLLKLDEIAPPPPPSNPFYDDSNPFADPNDNPFWSPTPAVVEFSRPDTYAYMSEEEKFERVKVLLKEKNYEEARQILMTLPDNPSAQKLLTKLHQVAPAMPTGAFGSTTTTSRKTNPPMSDPFGRPTSNPLGTSSSNVYSAPDSNPFAASSGSGMGYKVIPTKPSDTTSFMGGSSSYSSGTSFGQPTRRSSSSKAVSKGSSGAVIATGSLAWFGRRMVRRIIGGVVGLIFFGVTAVLGIDLENIFSTDETFKNNDIEMTYSSHWRSINLNSREDCTDVVGTCILFLHSNDSETAVRLQNLALLQGNHQTTINVLWDGYQRANYGLHQVGAAASFKIDGQDAVQWYVTWHSTEGYDLYGLIVYLPTANSVVEFSAWSNSQTIYTTEFQEVQALIDSIEIKNPPR